MSKNISPDSVRSCKTCPANLGVRSCPVRKLICPVRSSPIGTVMWYSLYTQSDETRGQRQKRQGHIWWKYSASPKLSWGFEKTEGRGSAINEQEQNRNSPAAAAQPILNPLLGFTGQMVHSTLYSKLSGYVVIEMKQKVVVVVIKI